MNRHAIIATFVYIITNSFTVHFLWDWTVNNIYQLINDSNLSLYEKDTGKRATNGTYETNTTDARFI